MIANIHTGFPNWPVTNTKRKRWLRRLQFIEDTITQTGATASYRPIGRFEITGTTKQIEQIRTALKRRRVQWQPNGG